ncbi:MAG: hypothetical protein MUE68_06960 [Bacteroidetes bacterium]|jgi:hypothetical protein|nr:hypothetical protein [Bacteroidota bacterium]
MNTPSYHRLIWLTLIYALLVSGLPVLQSAAFAPSGWTESRIVLAIFLVGPLLAAWLVHRGLVRPGSILLLGFMSSCVVINGLLLQQVHPPEFASGQWVAVLRIWVLLLMALNVVLAWTAFRVLRDYHRTSRTHDGPPAA